MTQLVKLEDLISIPSTHFKNPGVVACTGSLSAGGWGSIAPQVLCAATLAKSGQRETMPQKIKWRIIKEDAQDLCTHMPMHMYPT